MLAAPTREIDGWTADRTREAPDREPITETAQPRGMQIDREIVLDVCHLSLGFWRETPTGVDRVDASFAAHFLSADVSNRKALLFTPLGPRAVRSADARRILGKCPNSLGRDQAVRGRSGILPRTLRADPASPLNCYRRKLPRPETSAER